jgi:hypothetical protein
MEMNVRSLITTLLEGAGILLVVIGLWQFSASLAIIIAGLTMIGIGVRNA